jgi:beta-lactamase superfamily II metal-dependent hydrolase
VSDVHLTVLDVGHGSAAVLTGPDATVLIDSGPGPWVLRYLQDQRINHLDGVAITHTDADHLKGLAALIDSKEFTFGTVRVNSDAAKDSALWDSVAFSLDQLSRRQKVDFQVSLAVGDPLPQVATDVRVEVVTPSRYLASRGAGSTDRQGRPLATNSVSAVVRVFVDEKPQVLLAADIDVSGLENMLDGQDLRTPILIFPHHGGNVRVSASAQDNAEFTRRICEVVQPETVMFSLGRGRHSTPRPEIMKAIREYGADVRIACTQLSEACAESRPPIGAFGHLTSLPARGAEYQMCCAGTMRIPLTSDIEPDFDAHETFKDAYAETPQCRTAPSAISASNPKAAPRAVQQPSSDGSKAAG